MHIYGRKWDEALRKILMRLALDEGYGFLVIEGPDASGKTDLMNLVREITENKSTILELPDEENRRLGQMVYARRYLKIALEDASEIGIVFRREYSGNWSRPYQLPEHK